MPKLLVNPGSPAAWEIHLKPGLNRLGRGPANDFKFTDLSVSGTHCQIVVTGQSAVIKDLNSTNGTYINRAFAREATLEPGQTIHLGAVELLYVGEPQPGPVPAAAVAAPPPPGKAPAPGARAVPSATPVVRPVPGPGAPPTPQPIRGPTPAASPTATSQARTVRIVVPTPTPGATPAARPAPSPAPAPTPAPRPAQGEEKPGTTST